MRQSIISTVEITRDGPEEWGRITEQQESVLVALNEGVAAFGKLHDMVRHSSPGEAEWEKLGCALHNLQAAVVMTACMLRGRTVPNPEGLMFFFGGLKEDGE